MVASQQEAASGRRGRHTALTWDVPPPLESDKVAAAGRHAFAAVAAKHLQALVRQLLAAEGVQEAGIWAPLVCELAQGAAAALSPTAAVAHGKLDPRHYIKVKRLVAPGATPADSSLVLGVACRKSLAHKRMRGCIAQPRIMLLAGGLELQRGMGRGGSGAGFASSSGGSSAAPASQLSSFDALLDQEQQYLEAAVQRIAALSPDVLLVERSVGRHAQDLLLAAGISLVLNVKPEMMERIARCTGAQVAPSLDQLTSHCMGFCKEFEVESMHQPAASSAAAAGASSAEPSPRTPEAPEGHIIADAAAMRRAAAAGAVAGAPRALMLFRGCPRPLGSTIVLHGSDAGELRRVKRVAVFAAYAAYWGGLETALLSDQLVAAAAAVLPGGAQQADAVAGLADAVASTSFLATAEARGRQAIVSASPHVSLVLEPGVSGRELELLPAPAAAEGEGEGDRQRPSSSSSGRAWEDASGAAAGVEPGSPASSNSTDMWAVPAETAAATFTVSGSQSLAEAEEERRQQQQQGEEAGEEGEETQLEVQHSSSETEDSTPVARDSSPGALRVPGSPQDPLHLAAKELALQELQLMGSQPASPAAGAGPDAAAAERAVHHMQQQHQQLALGGLSGEAGPATVLQPSPPRDAAAGAAARAGAASALAAQQQQEAAAAVEQGTAASSSAPGTAPYRSQQLWLAISCKNPAKGILCEPSHEHCMQFYADTDLPLAAFLSAAAPPNRKCPHPQCGEGAPLHLRSFLHGAGLVTLSSVRLPAGKELPDGRLWLWLRPAGSQAAGDAQATAAARRVPMSPEAACLSFAHLLSLLLDARHLALGGLSLQREFVRYLGCGSTLLCLHFSPAVPYAVCMPPRHVELLPSMEAEWLQEEIKQLTEEADEAFGAIEYALGEQLAQLGEADPEFLQMWLDTLGDTRTSFLDMMQDTITLLDGGPLPGSEQGASAQVVHVVWEVNRLRSTLAAVVLQWATCLHEGSPSANAAPPSAAAGALSAALHARRRAHHSHHASADGQLPAVAQGQSPDADSELPSSPFSQAAAQQGPLEQQQQQQQPGSRLQQQAGDQQAQPQPGVLTGDPLPLEHQPRLPALQLPAAAAAAQRRQLPRRDSGGSLGRQHLQTATAAQLAAGSELNYRAPSLQGDDAGGGEASLPASPHASTLTAPAPIPSGLVARYVALFDQQPGQPGSSSAVSSGGSSPVSRPVARSQRTHEWVQVSSPVAAAAELAGDAGSSSLGSTAAQEAASTAAESTDPVAWVQQESPPQQQQQAPQQQEQQQQQQQLQQRSSMFRLDLTAPPDPELVQALTPKRCSSADESASLEALGSSSSRLERISARLAGMSLAKSFTERQRSFPPPLAQHGEEEPGLLQRLESVAEQQQQQQQPQQVDVEERHEAASSLGAAAVAATAQEATAAAAEAEDGERSSLSAVPEGQPGEEAARRDSTSHWDEWNALLKDGAPPPAAAAAGAAADAAAGGEQAPLFRSSSPLLQLLKTAGAGRHDAIAKLQEAPMPASLSAPAGALEAQPHPSAPADRGGAAVAAAASAPMASRGLSVPMPAAQVPATQVPPSTASSAPLGLLPTPSPLLPAAALPSEKQPNKLMQLLGKLRSDLQPGHMPLTAGRVELSGRALLPGGADGARVAIFDDEPTSIVAYFLSTREYQQYLHDAVATVLFGDAGQRGSGAVVPSATASGDGSAAGFGGSGEHGTAAAALPGSWKSLPGSPHASDRRSSSLLPSLQQMQQQRPGPPAGTAAAATAAPPQPAGDAAPAASAAPGAPPPSAPVQPPQPPQPPSGRTVSQEELAAEQSGDWQVLFHEQQLDCQLALEDPSPGMPWGRAKFQVTVYYAPQFAELRRRCVAGGEAAFLSSISRCSKWASCGGKSAAYFARSCDKRYIVKQLSRSERQSFLEFAPDYFRYVATMLHRGQETCLAKVLGFYQVSVQYTGGRGAPAAPPFGGKEGVMDLLVTENVFYGRGQVSRIYDLKGSQRDRYAAGDPAVPGAVLLDENLKELNLSSPTLVGPRAFARLQRALWSDTSFLSGLGVMDYSLLVGVDKARGELVVGVIDYIRQYSWDKQVETWVKKSGILGGAGKDPTVISPKQYSRRFRIAMSSYLTVVPAWEPPEPPLDPDAV